MFSNPSDSFPQIIKPRKRRFKKKHHRRTNSDVLSRTGSDAKILRAILNSQQRKQRVITSEPNSEKPKQHSQGSLGSTLESVDHILFSNKYMFFQQICHL